jgi:hypothetical protein
MGRAARAKAERKRLRETAGLAVADLGRLLVLWGIPGTGKSTFARWLSREKGFEHVDNDKVAMKVESGGALTNLEQAWKDVEGSPESFVTLVTSHSSPVVVEYGMFADEPGVRLLGQLRDLGAEPWWFDGDRGAAKEAWRDENRKGRRPFDDANWDRVVRVMEANRELVKGFFGARVLRTIEAGPVRTAPSEIYKTMVDNGRAGHVPG